MTKMENPELKALVSALPDALGFVLKYLEHPDVQAMSFALPASNPARMLREIIADAKELSS